MIRLSAATVFFLFVMTGCGSENAKQTQSAPQPPAVSQIDAPPIPGGFENE